MIAALLLAAGASVVPVRTVDQRVSLLEARQMLQSQAVWTLQAAMTPEAAKAINDLDMHLAEDRDRDDKMQALEQTIARLEQRLAAVELLLGDRPLAENGAVRVAPAAPVKPPPLLSDLVIKVKPPQAKTAKGKHSPSGQAARSQGKDSGSKPRTAVSSQP